VNLPRVVELARWKRGPGDDLALSPDGKVVALDGDGLFELRSAVDGSLLQHNGDLPGPVRGMSFFPGGQTIAVVAGDSLVRLYRVKDGRFISTLGLPGKPMWAVAFSPDRKWLAWGGEGQRIYLYDLERDFLVLTIAEPYVPIRLAFSADSSLLASMTSDGVNIRDLNGTLVRSLGGVGLEDMSFWLDDSQLALAGNEVARVVDLDSGKDLVLLDYRTDDAPTTVAYTPDQRENRAILGGHEGTAPHLRRAPRARAAGCIQPR
jgi:WD40 repeat protein